MEIFFLEEKDPREIYSEVISEIPKRCKYLLYDLFHQYKSQDSSMDITHADIIQLNSNYFFLGTFKKVFTDPDYVSKDPLDQGPYHYSQKSCRMFVPFDDPESEILNMTEIERTLK